jgi:hypothetical protein
VPATPEALLEELRATREAVQALTVDAHRSKRLAAVAIVMAVIVVIVVAGGAFGYARLAHTEATAEAARTATVVNQQNALRQCRSQNATRTQTVGLWEFLIGLLPKPAPGSPGAQLDQKFLTHLHQVYAPRNCDGPDPDS